MRNSPAFTIIELVFIFIIIGILGTIALPKLGSTIEDAQYAKGKNDVAAIRSSIATKRGKKILAGKGAKYPELNGSNSLLFSNVLDYSIYEKKGNGHWQMIDNTHYTYTVENTPIIFTYNINRGFFDCNHKDKNEKIKIACKRLTE